MNRFSREKREHDGTVQGQKVGGQADGEEKIEIGNMSETRAVGGFQRDRLQRLDPSAAGIRRVLLPRCVHVPAGQPHERVQPRGHADADELRQPDVRHQVLLRAHQTRTADVALRGRRGEIGRENVPGNDRGGVRLSVGPVHRACPAISTRRARPPHASPTVVGAQETASSSFLLK